jgi:hypothetical protein
MEHALRDEKCKKKLVRKPEEQITCDTEAQMVGYYQDLSWGNYAWGCGLHSSGSGFSDCPFFIFCTGYESKQTYMEQKCGIRIYDYILHFIRRICRFFICCTVILERLDSLAYI